MTKYPAIPKLFLCSASLASALGLVACGGHKGQEDEQKPVPAFVRDGNFLVIPEKSGLRNYVAVEPARAQVLQTPLEAPAVLEADPSRVANILPPLSGRISVLSVHLGDTVKVGQPLFTIDSSELAQARSDLQHARQQLQLTQKAYVRTQDLALHGIAAQKDLEQAESDYQGAQTELERASAVFRTLGISPESTDSSRQLTVHAPAAGRVSMLAAVAGTFANDATAPLMTISDVSTIWFTASVQEKDLGVVAPGESVTATVQSFVGETFIGKVTFIADQLDPDTRTIKVRVAYDNRDGRLKPGMFAKVTFLGNPHTAVVVPTTALIQNESRTQVFVEVSPWKFEPRVVIAGATQGDTTEVLTGLKAGERVVTRQGVLLQ
jgi:cobalt-zinc-cadmium efflux system membrane fusion protein